MVRCLAGSAAGVQALGQAAAAQLLDCWNRRCMHRARVHHIPRLHMHVHAHIDAMWKFRCVQQRPVRVIFKYVLHFCQLQACFGACGSVSTLSTDMSRTNKL